MLEPTSNTTPGELLTGELTLAPRPRRGLSNRELAQMIIEEADRADAAETQVAVLAAAAESWHVLASARGDFSVADAAKVLNRDPSIDVGERRLFTILSEFGWIFRQRGDRRWRAYQAAIDSGRLAELPQNHHHPRTGQLELDPPQVRVTLKGVEDLRRLLGRSRAIPLASPGRGRR